MEESTWDADKARDKLLADVDAGHVLADHTLLAEELGCTDTQCVGLLKSLEARNILTLQQGKKTVVELTPKGVEALASDLPEEAFFKVIAPGDVGTPLDEVKTAMGSNFGAAFGACRGCKAVTLDKARGHIVRLVEAFTSPIRVALEAVSKGNTGDVDKRRMASLGKQRLVDTRSTTLFSYAKGDAFTLKPKRLCADITVDMLADESWKEVEFKGLNPRALGTVGAQGHLAPLLKVRSAFRRILLELGFQEMPTNQYVESSFWNFDALFQPQQHPARDAHDTFFLTQPESARFIPKDYMERVRRMHESGEGCEGSIGWRYKWSEDEARKNLLRTHTTAVSSRVLYRLAQRGWQPGRYFSIDKVFRNEPLDATHLAEFFQVEGFVVDRGLGLVDLIGILGQFFAKLGIHKLEFKPAYNPYTEPSMEIFGHHPGLGKMIEIGNSGVFRPEMLQAMGCPSDVSVIAWGLGVERNACLKYNIKKVGALIGDLTDVQFTRDNPLCMFTEDDPLDVYQTEETTTT